MNLKAYIESGILELYALHLLDESERGEVQALILQYRQLKEEVERIEHTLESYAQKTAIQPPEGLKEKIKDALDNNNFELISKHADYNYWLNLVKNDYPEAFQQANFFNVIRDQDGLKQVLVVSSFDIEDETHQDVYESFLILQGKCRCTVGTDVFYLEAGGYTQIPLDAHHQVEIIEAPVMAIVQYTAAK